jgi:methylase of polypeptide subunit release factors
MLKMLLDGRTHRAELPQGKSLRILDIGTGTGIWAIDMGDEFPNAEIVCASSISSSCNMLNGDIDRQRLESDTAEMVHFCGIPQFAVILTTDLGYHQTCTLR